MDNQADDIRFLNLFHMLYHTSWDLIIVRHNDKCRFLITDHVLQYGQDFYTGIVIQRSRRFVGKNHSGRLCNCSCNRYALLLSAAQCGRQVVRTG